MMAVSCPPPHSRNSLWWRVESISVYVYMTEHRHQLNRKQKAPFGVHPKVCRIPLPRPCIYSKMAASYLCITGLL